MSHVHPYGVTADCFAYQMNHSRRPSVPVVIGVGHQKHSLGRAVHVENQSVNTMSESLQGRTSTDPLVETPVIRRSDVTTTFFPIQPTHLISTGGGRRKLLEYPASEVFSQPNSHEVQLNGTTW
jgi:hypothetical protein